MHVRWRHYFRTVEMAGNKGRVAGEKALLIFLSSIVPYIIEELVLFATNGNFKRFQILNDTHHKSAHKDELSESES